MEQKHLEKLLREIGLTDLVERNGNLMHCCPFHPERQPSWGISTVIPHFHGCFACHEKGVLQDLLTRVGRYSVAKAKKVCQQGEFSQRRDFAVLKTGKEDTEIPEIDETELFPFVLEHKACTYLEERGISSETAEKVGCVYSPDDDRILFPWYYNGRLVGITGRSLNPNEEAKVLPFYGTKKSLSLFLPNKRILAAPLILVEGEIDATKVFDIGFPNVGGLGYGSLSKAVKTLVLNSPATGIVSFTDDDDTGKLLREQISAAFRKFLPVGVVEYAPFRKKIKYLEKKLDPAELTRTDLRKALTECVNRYADWPDITVA
jgi:DNA primase